MINPVDPGFWWFSELHLPVSHNCLNVHVWSMFLINPPVTVSIEVWFLTLPKKCFCTSTDGQGDSHTDTHTSLTFSLSDFVWRVTSASGFSMSILSRRFRHNFSCCFVCLIYFIWTSKKTFFNKPARQEIPKFVCGYCLIPVSGSSLPY